MNFTSTGFQEHQHMPLKKAFKFKGFHLFPVPKEVIWMSNVNCLLLKTNKKIDTWEVFFYCAPVKLV